MLSNLSASSMHTKKMIKICISIPNKPKFSLVRTYCPPQREKYQVYNSFLACGRGQILEMGRLNVPFAVFTVTTRTFPSGPG